MAQAKESKKDKPAHRVLMYAQTAEDISILQDILAGIGAEGVVCTDTWDLCWQMAQDTDAVLLTEQSLADGALPILAEALEGQPEWSDLPVLFVAAGGTESPLAVQAMQELRNVVILDRPVRIATLASVLRMASRVRDKQRQVRDLLQERDRQEQRLRQLTELLEEDVKAKTETLTDTIDRLHDEVAGRTLAEGELYKSSQMLEAFFEHTISPLVFMDRNFNFVRVNEAYARVHGKSPEYFVGKNLFALYPSLEDQAIFEEVMRTRQPYRAYAKPFAFPDAPQPNVTYWNWWLTPLLNNLGEVQLLVLNLEDVTERQKAFSRAAGAGAPASATDTGTIADGGPRAQASGGNPARRPAAVARGGQVPRRPPEPSRQGRRRVAGDGRAGQSDARGGHREIPQPVA